MKKCCWLLFLLLSVVKPKAQQLVQEATFHLQSAEYSLSLEKGLLAFEKDSARNRFGIARIIAISYEKMGMNEEALPWYERLIHPKNKNLDDQYKYAVCLKNNGFYLKSIRVLKKYQLQKGTIPVDDLLQSCRKAITQIHDSTVWQVTNVQKINTTASEFGWIDFDEGYLITSDRQVDSAEMIYYKWTGLPYQKILYAKPYAGTDSLVADTLAAMINRSYAHAGAPALTPSGDTLFFTATDPMNKRAPKVNKKEDQIQVIRNGLYYTVRDSGGWKKPVAFLYNEKSKYHVMHPAIDRTGKLLVFVSDQPGGFGGMDLYYSVKERDSFWSPPCNLGAVVNSSADEVFPSFDSSGRLRFSSNRLAGRGALDIYEMENPLKADTADGVLVHLPYPFNSAADDFYLMDGKDEKKYFSSNRPGGKGLDDIYEVEQKGKAVVKLFFDYKDSIRQEEVQIQSFVGMRDLRTNQEWIQVLAADGSFVLPVTERTEQLVSYYAKNGKKYVVNDTIKYHPSYPKYGMVKKYPQETVSLADEEEPVEKKVATKPSIKNRSKKKKGR